uniref:Ubiquitin-like domain-containing protein n=1 Tax=Solanum lycopersicum TaxID=4081 RepID=A0A3Q7IRJ0_SOLLC
MHLFFYPTKGSSFAIEVDTILEVKEKIQKYQGIPIPKQTLIFEGNILADDLNVHYSDILDRSHIQLVTDFEGNKNVVVKSERPRIKLLLEMPTLTKLAIMLKVDVGDNSEIDVSIWSGTIASPPTTNSSESSVNN